MIDTRIFRIGLAHSSPPMRPTCCCAPRSRAGWAHRTGCATPSIGFGGGLIGGLTAMPGALPTMWCELRGVPKDQQRGFVQPYITAMQLSALAVMFWHNTFSSQALLNLTYSLPALASGAGAELASSCFARSMATPCFATPCWRCCSSPAWRSSCSSARNPFPSAVKLFARRRIAKARACSSGLRDTDADCRGNPDFCHAGPRAATPFPSDAAIPMRARNRVAPRHRTKAERPSGERRCWTQSRLETKSS